MVSRMFFRQLEVVGLENIPTNGPVMFTNNHPNSLIDPILIITTYNHKVHFATKNSLFKDRIMRTMLSALGTVPVQRHDDHDNTTNNNTTFTTMFDVLKADTAIGIFPKDLSHDETHLSRLKTDTARLVLGTSITVPIVPYGLTFIHPKRFRNRVLVQYGTPIKTKDDAKEMTTAIQRALERLTINAPNWDTVRTLDKVRRLYRHQ